MEVVDNRLILNLDDIQFDAKQVSSWNSQTFKDFFKLNQIFKVQNSPLIVDHFPDFNQIQMLNLSFNFISKLDFLQQVILHY